MSKNSIHDFHFVMNKGLEDKLKSLNIFKECKSVSGMIVKILKILTPVITKEHKWGKQRMCRYKAVCNDPDEARKHFHVYVPDDMYRELKVLHQDLNFYSIAQLVREIISFFFGLVILYKNEVLEELEKIFTKWREDDDQERLTSRKFIRQLWKIIRHLPGKNRLITVYDYQYSPFWVTRI
ncbi:MAG: hypothetical protein JXJ04_09810 [Spirochaetales bacterium]|nr:hypothetical protein [Spirochaetales bacterium]